MPTATELVPLYISPANISSITPTPTMPSTENGLRT